MLTSTKRVADYNDPAFNYKKYWQARQYEHLAEEIALKKLFHLIPQKNSLVDIGGGFGRLTPCYAPVFQKTLLVDPSSRLLKTAKKLEKKYKNFKVLKGKVCQLPLPNASFETALMIRTAHHLVSLDKALKEIDRVLKPQGFLVLEFANKLHFKAIIKNLLRLNFYDFIYHTPKEKSAQIIFANFHPTAIVSLLKKNHFQIIKAISVSNFRSTFLKKILPLKILLLMEKIAQKIYPAYISGPSVFVLAKKT
jgi:ubiquinone/menaquinone biosynthesis C-methylase UbiE